MSYFKKDMINDCYLSVKRNQLNGKKLEDLMSVVLKNYSKDAMKAHIMMITSNLTLVNMNNKKKSCNSLLAL